MNLPIIACEGQHDITIFSTVDDAESYLEAIDVYNNEYVVYDSCGSLLDIGLTSGTSRVFIRDKKSPVMKPEELRQILANFLGNVPKFNLDSEWLKTATFEEIVDKSVELISYKECTPFRRILAYMIKKLF